MLFLFNTLCLFLAASSAYMIFRLIAVLVCKCLHLVRVTIEGGGVITSKAVKPTELDKGSCLIGNKIAQLIVNNPFF